MCFAPSETNMWKSLTERAPTKISDVDINAKYERGEKRILTEMNREKLPSFAEALKKPGYMNTRPFYQRRKRWNTEKQSLLIESFLINIPVPPIILYENDYNSYEVMDGQQRIGAIQDFYENKLTLKGLEIWPELNGKTYSQLPEKIKAGIDRRSISTIVVITESTSDPDEAFFLKQISFERINTGGVALSKQEIRNCLYSGEFNQLLLELSKNPLFAKAWDIPLEDNEALENNNLYKRMEDVELILRFFALRHFENFRGGMEEFLTLYMAKSTRFTKEDIQILNKLFVDTITLASKIYGDKLFKPYSVEKTSWENRAYKAYYDAVMVGVSQYLSKSDILISRIPTIIEKTKELFEDDKSKIFTGGGKTKEQVQQRIKLFGSLLEEVITK